ncbi:MAG TPA: NADPH-dependent FMN reductase [Patescibacteria group bacterium]|nr:NADPH-dependent FMN reductase [Patescibacteria group bacterium]
MLNIPVVLGSVRQGRKSEAPAKYLVQKIKQLGHNSRLVDFRELPLPFYDQPGVPIMFKGKYPTSQAQAWSDIAKAADAFVIVSPEYNHGYPAVLKNALDWLYLEFEKKPFALVGVSNGPVGGARLIEHLRPIIENFGAVALRETVMLGPIDKYFGEDGRLLDDSADKKTDGLLASLVWWGNALKQARENPA